MLDITAEGSHREMYFWDVIHGMYVEWENDRAKGDKGTTIDPEGKRGPKRRPRGGSRKKPLLQSERRNRGQGLKG